MTCTIERIHPLDFRTTFWNLQRLWKQHKMQLQLQKGKRNKRFQKLEDILQRHCSTCYLLFLSCSGEIAERKSSSPLKTVPGFLDIPGSY